MDALKTGRKQPRRRKPGEQESTMEVQRRRIPEVKVGIRVKQGLGTQYNRD